MLLFPVCASVYWRGGSVFSLVKIFLIKISNIRTFCKTVTLKEAFWKYIYYYKMYKSFRNGNFIGFQLLSRAEMIEAEFFRICYNSKAFSSEMSVLIYICLLLFI